LNKLIIAPHADDETLGCGGILDKDCLVFICAIDESEFGLSVYDRVNELWGAAKNLNYGVSIAYAPKVNHLEVTETIAYLEEKINSYKPDALYIPHPGYNQDHRVVYEAAITATRPHETNFFVKKVLVYEAVHDFIWSHNIFTPNYFVPIDIEKKLKAFSYYKSQMQTHRSLDVIRQIAALRGVQANVPYAEAYRIVRWVE
jgi:N-acetylglucosamine malate deacetylase 1